MSGFTTINKPVVPNHAVKPLTVSWPIVGTYNGITYTINGGGNTPSSFTYGTYGPFGFTHTGMGGTWTTGRIVAGEIHEVNLGIYTNMEGYWLSFNGSDFTSNDSK